MRSSRALIFLDSNTIITSNESTFSRHSQYAFESQNFIDSEIEFIVLQPRCKNESEITFKSEYLGVHRMKSSNWNLLGRIFEYRNFLQTFQNRKIAFVCGDPWKPVLQLFLLRVIGLHKYPFQVQVHFDIFDPKWRYANFKNFLKYILAMPGLYLASNLRFVSEHQARPLKTKHSLNAKKLFVTPVPLNLDFTEIIPNKVPRKRCIGFLGRLSEDRGVKYLEFVAGAIQNSDIRMTIAGSGPESDRLNVALSRILESHRINFPGYLEGPDLNRFWSSIGVLVSTAESESYGRTIRESLCHGVPVIALNSLGALEIKLGPLSEFVHLYNKDEIQNITLGKIESCLSQNIGYLGLNMEANALFEHKKKLYASWSDLYET
jgi:glycosyltransferase involved in cell wall biosynthesis